MKLEVAKVATARSAFALLRPLNQFDLLLTRRWIHVLAAACVLCCWALFTGRVDISDLHSRRSRKVSVQTGAIGLAEQHLEEDDATAEGIESRSSDIIQRETFMPSAHSVAEHMVTHLPYRSWVPLPLR